MSKHGTMGGTLTLEVLQQARLAVLGKEIRTPEQFAAADAHPHVTTYIMSQRDIVHLLEDCAHPPESPAEARLLRAKCEGEAERWQNGMIVKGRKP